jgi:hypothetical protein
MEERSSRVFFLVVALCVLLFLHHCDATEYDHKVNKPLYYKTPFLVCAVVSGCDDKLSWSKYIHALHKTLLCGSKIHLILPHKKYSHDVVAVYMSSKRFWIWFLSSFTQLFHSFILAMHGVCSSSMNSPIVVESVCALSFKVLVTW